MQGKLSGILTVTENGKVFASLAYTRRLVPCVHASDVHYLHNTSYKFITKRVTVRYNCHTCISVQGGLFGLYSCDVKWNTYMSFGP